MLQVLLGRLFSLESVWTFQFGPIDTQCNFHKDLFKKGGDVSKATQSAAQKTC